MARVTVTLKADEHDALRTLAEREYRDPRAQVALIIRRELERLGLLTTNPQADKEPAKAKVELKVELKELQMQVEKKGDISGEHFIAHCLRYIGRLAPDILDVVIATLGSPVGGLMLVIKKLAEKAKELAGKS